LVKEEIRFKGIIDVGIIALSHCKNPAQKSSLIFFSKVVKLEIPYLIPVLRLVGAYHLMTNFLKVSPKDVKDALLNTLQFKKPIFIEDINKNLAKRALELAEKSRFESWD